MATLFYPQSSMDPTLLNMGGSAEALFEASQSEHLLDEQLRLVWPDHVYPSDLSLAFTFAHLPASKLGMPGAGEAGLQAMLHQQSQNAHPAYVPHHVLHQRLDSIASADTVPLDHDPQGFIDFVSDNDSMGSPSSPLPLYLDAATLTPPSYTVVGHDTRFLHTNGQTMAPDMCEPAPASSTKRMQQQSKGRAGHGEPPPATIPSTSHPADASHSSAPAPAAVATPAYKRMRSFGVDSNSGHDMAPIDGERRELKRMKNREAAARCRFRRKKLIDDLQQQADSLMTENDTLRNELQMLMDRVRMLEAKLSANDDKNKRQL